MRRTLERHGRVEMLGLAALLLSSRCVNDAPGANPPAPAGEAPAPAPTANPSPAAMPPSAQDAAGSPAPSLPDPGPAPASAGSDGTPAAQPPAAPTNTPPNNGAMPPADMPAGQNPVAQNPAFADPRGGCPGLSSGYPGDEACIAPPPPGEGLQIHVGPKNYADAAEVAPFLLHAGEETSECWSYHTPNSEDVYFQGWTLSGRPGTHHIFNSMLTVEVTDGGGFHLCVDAGLGNAPDRLGSLPGAAKPYMPRTPVAPENEGLGQQLKANTPSEADMHYFNTTDRDILREFWLNLYFIPKDKVTQQPTEVRGMGGLGWAALPIPAGTENVYKYECPIASDGRLISMLGHFHAHGKRETVSLRRANGTREKVFEMYDYTSAAVFAFDSVTTNAPLTDGVDGALSGRIDLKAGDVLEWECHIVNDSSVGLTYSNNVQQGEMCNVFGMSVGPTINCLVP